MVVPERLERPTLRFVVSQIFKAGAGSRGSCAVIGQWPRYAAGFMKTIQWDLAVFPQRFPNKGLSLVRARI